VSDTSDLEYKNSLNLKIASRDNYGRVVTRSKIPIEVKPPIFQSFTHIEVSSKLFRLSGCIIPGFDPLKDRKKDCQDDYGIFENPSSFLVALFDGHGTNGHIVSKFCKDYMESYYLSNSSQFEDSPKSSIDTMIQSCDTSLKQSQIDTFLSGTTAVVLYLNSQGIHVGSVGDSRAILATIPKILNEPNPAIKSTNRYTRSIVPTRKLQAIALTIDQKPNHSQELKRIQNSGGEVRRIADELGNPLGPYRVWVKGGKTPGLGMSRAIGDKVAASIGVIPTPILNSFKIYSDLDQFFVIASDGIWDVMENIEVINFVEKFRGLACSRQLTQEFPAKLSNSTIARLLCEEARYRWFGILENEDVCVDDISCVIIEITNIDSAVNLIGAKNENRQANEVFNSMAVEGVVDVKRDRAARNDPTRGSTADIGIEFLAEALR